MISFQFDFKFQMIKAKFYLNILMHYQFISSIIIAIAFFFMKNSVKNLLFYYFLQYLDFIQWTLNENEEKFFYYQKEYFHHC